jgi:hypothetical protein
MMSNSGAPSSDSNGPVPSDDVGVRLDRIAAALEKQNELSQKRADGDAKKGADGGEKKGGEGGKNRDQEGKKRKGLIQRIGGKRTLFVVGTIILLIAIFLGIRYWLYASSHETTDDAYVAGHTHQISPRISGTIQQVLVDDNWYVKAGQPLVQLDPSDSQGSLQRAQAQLQQSEAQAL